MKNMKTLSARLHMIFITYVVKTEEILLKGLPIRAARGGEQVDDRSCTDAGCSGGHRRCVCGSKWGPLGEFFQPLLLERHTHQFRAMLNHHQKHYNMVEICL